MDKYDDQTLHQALARRGLGSRKPAATLNSDRREIYRVVGDEVLGQYTAHEAWAMLAEMGMSNKAMESKLTKGECLDVSGCKRTPDGDYILEHVVSGMDYCDAKLEAWVYSIGQRNEDGVILASISSKFYQNPKFKCLWLR